MTTLAYDSPFQSRPERRLTTFVVASLGALVVPVLAATGLALPLPSVIYRLAVDVARTTESVTLRVGEFAVDLGGDERPAPPARIVLTAEERQERASSTAAARPAPGPARTVTASRRPGESRTRVPSSVPAARGRASASTALVSSPSSASAKNPIAAEPEQSDSPATATAPPEPAPTPAQTPTPTPATPRAEPTPPANTTPSGTRRSPGVRTPAEPTAPAGKPTASDDAPVSEPTDPAPSGKPEPDEKVAEDPVATVRPPLPPVVEDTAGKATEKTTAVVEGAFGTAADSVPSLQPPRNLR